MRSQVLKWTILFAWVPWWFAAEQPLQAQNIQMTGSRTQILADGGRVAWSANNLIAYDHQGGPSPGVAGYFNVYTMTTSGGSQTCITCPTSLGASVLPGLHVGNPVWTPDGKFLLFQAQSGPSQGGGPADFAGFPGEGAWNDVWATDTKGNFWQLTTQGRWGSRGILSVAIVSPGTDSGLPNSGTWTTTGGGCSTPGSGTFTAVGGNLSTVTVPPGGSGSGCTSNPTFVPSSGSLGTSTVSFLGSGAVIYITISSDGTKLAWGQRLVPGGATENSDPGNWALAVANFSESGGIPSINNTQLYTPGINKFYMEPHTFSLDGSLLFFMGNLDPGMGTYARNIYSFNLGTQALVNLTNSNVDWNEYPTALPATFGINAITYMHYPNVGSQPGQNPNCISDFWVMNYDGTNNYQLTFFNTPGNPNYQPTSGQPVCMDDHHWNAGGTQLVAFPNYFAANGHTGSPGPDWILDVSLVGLPSASNVAVSGTLSVGDKLTGSYTFSDPNGNPESGSTYQWLEATASNGTYSNIGGATGISYTLVAADAGNYLKFQVTPASLSGIGASVQSSPTGQIQGSASPPTITSPAAANPSPVSGKTTTLSVAATDANYPTSSLTYSWVVTGTPPATPQLATPSAASTLVTFSQAGTYNFQVTVKNPAGDSVPSTVQVVVNQTVTSVTVTPASVQAGSQVTVAAAANDQFGNAMNPQPSFNWSVAGGGAINPTTGVFTAGNTAGTYTATATAESVPGTGSVTVTNGPPPTITSPAAANPSPVSGKTTTLSVAATDANYPTSSLTYSWVVTGTPPATPQLATPSAASTLVTFSQAGTYNFQVTVKNPAGDSVPSTVQVVVNQTVTLVTVTPASVQAGSQVTVAAAANDQFGNAMNPQPSFNWSVAGGGAINPTTGVFTAGNTAGTYTVTATAESVPGTGSVTVTNGPPPTITSPAAANPSPVSGKTTTLSVAATDANYPTSSLTYSWVVTGTPPATPQLATPSAASTLVTFSQAGTYNFQVTVKNPAGDSVPSSVQMVVEQTLNSIVVTAPSGSLQVNTSYSFTASALDQFGNAMASPTLSWSVQPTATASIDNSGNFTAANAGVYVITAQGGGVMGSATVSVGGVVPPPGPVPVLTSLSPIYVTAGDSGFMLTVNGTGFAQGASILFNGSSRTTIYTSATQVQAAISVGDIASVGNVSIAVTNPGRNVSNSLTLGIVLPPQVPVLDLPEFLPLNAVVQFTDSLDASFQWTLNSQGNSAVLHSQSLDTSEGSPTFSAATPAPALNLGTFSLSPGPITIQVVAVNKAGQASAPGTATVTLVGDNLNAVRIYPNPWRSDKHQGIPITFDHLTLGSTIKLFDTAGRWVKTLTPSSDSVSWDRTNDSGDTVASGLYLYLITDNQGNKTRGVLTIIK